MFEPQTILARKEPLGTEEEPHPYDRVKVIGQSPIQHATSTTTAWAGADAFGFVVQPLEAFAPTLDKPAGELNELYYIEEFPEDPLTGEPIRPENNPRNRPSPEQALARAAEGLPAPKPRKRLPSTQEDTLSPEQALRKGNKK